MLHQLAGIAIVNFYGNFRVVEENLRNTAMPIRSDNARFNFLLSIMFGEEAFVSVGSAACSRCLKHTHTHPLISFILEG